MKFVILAAGRGTRLAPYTDNYPKCMVRYEGRPIIDYILEAAYPLKLEIGVIGGYKIDELKIHLKTAPVSFFLNLEFATTNMVKTFFCAESFFSNDDVVISYSDIVYRPAVLEKICQDVGSDISVVVDRKWKELWSQRMPDPLMDAETLKIDQVGMIKELGKKPQSYKDIEGQYIGLIKISKSALPRVIDFYKNLPKDVIYDGKDFNNMFMTSFLQKLIDANFTVKPVYIDGGWLEIDAPEDLKSKMV
jgi:choline kinase